MNHGQALELPQTISFFLVWLVLYHIRIVAYYITCSVSRLVFSSSLSVWFFPAMSLAHMHMFCIRTVTVGLICWPIIICVCILSSYSTPWVALYKLCERSNMS